MNWGKGLALALAVFAGLMTWFVIMSLRNPEPLVTEEYYEEELKYQQRIDNTERSNELSALVRMDVMRDAVHLFFPKELHAIAITGELTLQRPNDPSGDLVLQVATDSTGSYHNALVRLVPGRYNALLEWGAAGERYYTEEKLVVQ